MHSADQSNIELQIFSLERRLQRAERWALLNRIGWTTIATLILLLLWTNNLSVGQAQTSKLRICELDIVDEQGRERIVIASPLPDPMVNGKVEKRIRVVSAGVQFKDPNGTERGGIAASDDGSLMFGIDDEQGRERAHLYYIPKRGSGVYLQGENNKETVSLLLPSGGRDPNLEMTNQAGNLVVAVPSRK